MSTDHNDGSPPPAAEPKAARPVAQPRMLLIGVGVLVLGAAVIALRPKRRPSGPPTQSSARDLLRPGAPPSGGATGAPTPPGAYPAAGAAELALVAPLAVGDPLAGGVVTRISAVQQGFMHVLATKDGQTFNLGVGLARAGVAGLRAGPYVVYILGSTTPNPAAYPIADALVRVIRLNAATPAPPGMSEGTFGGAAR
jgi:hypothetical protein